MTRRDALIRVIESLHAEIAALKANDVSGLEAATRTKLSGIDALAAWEHEPSTAEIRGLAEEAHRLNEMCRIYVNLMTANVRRRLQILSGTPLAGYGPAGAFA